jgi:hypothetical protein
MDLLLWKGIYSLLCLFPVNTSKKRLNLSSAAVCNIIELNEEEEEDFSENISGSEDRTVKYN